MPHITARDGTRLYYEEAGSGSPVIFVHEYAGDYRTWEMQMRFFSRAHRCITYSQRGYPPSDVPKDGARYSQDIARDDVLAVMDALKVDKAHVVGHSMGAYTALHVGIHAPARCISVVAAGCGWGSSPDAKKREEMKALAAETGKMFAEEGIARRPLRNMPTRRCARHRRTRIRAATPNSPACCRSIPRKGMRTPCSISSSSGRRYGRWRADLKKFSVPLLVIVGDEDEPCIDGSVYLKRTAPTAGLLVIPRTGHNVPTEEPAAFNTALADLFAAAEAGRWLAHKPSK